MPGQISQIGWKSIEITLYACLVELVELGGQIGWTSIEITLYAWSNRSNWVVELGGHPLRLHCMPGQIG